MERQKAVELKQVMSRLKEQEIAKAKEKIQLEEMKARTKPIVAQSSETLEATTATDSAGKKS